MQRKALYVVFDCAPAHAELESEILYLVVSPDTDRFPDGAASFACRHPDLDLLCRFAGILYKPNTQVFCVLKKFSLDFFMIQS